MSRRENKSIFNLVALPFPPILDSFLLPVSQPRPRVYPYRVLSNPPYLSNRHLNIPWMTFLFHHLRQSMHNPSIDIFTLWGNTKGYTSITHISHKPDWTPASSALSPPYSFMVRYFLFKVSTYVPNYPIFWSKGTTFADG